MKTRTNFTHRVDMWTMPVPSRKSLTPLRSCCKTSWERQESLPFGVWRRKPSARHPGRAGNHFLGGGGKKGSMMQGPKDAPAKALVWKQSRKPDRDGHKHYQAKTAAGCYIVAAEYQPGKGFIGYRVTQSVA